MAMVVKVSESGRLSLPSQLRKVVGLEKGGPVSIWVEDGELRVRAVRDVMESLQTDAKALFAGTNESVDQFIADRRAEAEREGP